MRKDYNFSRAKKPQDIPHLARLQSEAKGKSAVTIMLDDQLLMAFRAQAELEGIDYQALISRVLQDALDIREPKPPE